MFYEHYTTNFFGNIVALFMDRYTRGELISFCSDLEKMYEQMKGEVVFKDSEEALLLEISIDQRGYVIIKARYKENAHREIELIFELKTTQPQIAELIKDLKQI